MHTMAAVLCGLGQLKNSLNRCLMALGLGIGDKKYVDTFYVSLGKEIYYQASMAAVLCGIWALKIGHH